MTLSPHSGKQVTCLVLPLSFCRRKKRSSSSSLPHAHVAPPDVVPLLPAFGERGGGAGLYPRQPEAVDVSEVVAGTSRPLTLNEGLRPEVCQTAAR